jgi:cell shape-determining protein MreC
MNKDNKRKVELLDKLANLNVSADELYELKLMLKSEAHKRKTDALAAAIIIARIDVMLYDLRYKKDEN